jgi:hypothetical protein
MFIMSETILRKEEQVVTTKEASASVPVHVCFENFMDIGNMDSWADHAALVVGNIAYVKDAP